MIRTKFNNGIKGIPKGAVLADAKKQRTKLRESGRWLYNAIPFDQGHYLDEGNKALANQLFRALKLEDGYKIEQKQKDFEILLANLFNQLRKPIMISLNSNDYKQTKFNKVSYHFIYSFINVLSEYNLINMKPGIYTDVESFMTRIWATEKLLDAFPEYHIGVRYKPVQLVEVWSKKIVRDRVIKKLINYRETEEVRKIRRVLEETNKVNNEANVMYVVNKRCLILNTGLVAKFTNKLTLGGRLYTGGISRYQGLSGEERKDITINGHPTVEIDFSALHPYLLYAAVGIQCDEDPYGKIENSIVARPFLKAILLRMINCRNKYQAKVSANRWLNKQTNSYLDALDELDIASTKSLIDKFMDVHKPIAHYLCTGKVTGLKLMNKDSKIALDVINHFIKQGIPILCIHDSFIVERQYADELESTMRSTYAKHTRLLDHLQGFQCKIKRKS